MKKTLAAGGAVALLVGLGAFLQVRAQEKKTPAEHGDECPLAHAKGGTVEVPFGDREKMKELQGLDGKSHARVKIEWPKEDQVLDKGEGAVQYELTGYEIGKDEKGSFQHCHLILDSKPYEADYDHTTTLEKLNGGKPVDEGSHLLTIFPARNFHLSVKNEGACAQVRFHVKKKTDKVPAIGAPQLVYSRPKGTYDSAKGEAKNVLLDFYLLNATLSKETDRVKLTLADDSGKTIEERSIDEWWPQILMKDARPGKYKVTLELVGKDGVAVPGAFNRTTREITVK